MAIDPAQSFSNALNQGLGIMKSYRDEARVDEETAFNRQMALKVDGRAEKATEVMMAGEGRDKEQNVYDIGRRGFNEKVADEELRGKTLLNEGTAKNNSWIDQINTESIASSKARTGQGWANVRNDAARVGIQQRQLDLQIQESAAARADAESKNAFRLLVTSIQSGDYKGIANNPRVGNSVLRMAGAAVGARDLVSAMNDPTGQWLQDPRQKRAVLNVAAIDLGKSADNLGFRRGTLSISDLRPSKEKGMVNIDFVGINPRTGKLEKKSSSMPAARLFDKAAVFSNTMKNIADDPKARTSLVSAFRTSDPELFGEMLKFEVSRREDALKGLNDGTLKVSNKLAYQTEIGRELTLLRNNDPNTVGSILFPRMAKVGREYTQSNTTRAYDRIEGMAGKGSDVLKGINSVIDKASRDPRYYAAILKKGGIPNSGGFDPNKVLQAIGG